MGKKVFKKGLAVVVILLFIGVAFAPSINAFDDPVPDLDCCGELDWVDVEPGATVIGSFTVENIGEEGSLLDWEIESFPDWGTWTFDPDGGIGLEEGNILTVVVEVVAPDDPETEFEGEVVLVNSNDPDDICTIDISLPTYTQKSSDEDCGCEDGTTEWFFPMICTLLLPAWTIAFYLLLMSDGMIWQPAEFMAQIGSNLNCYWKLD
jgi:hypothetical protein